jgi:hypothetical protein
MGTLILNKEGILTTQSWNSKTAAVSRNGVGAVLIPKVANYGLLKNLPVADASAVCTVVSTFYEIPMATVLAPDVNQGNCVSVRVKLRNLAGAVTRTMRIVSAGGAVLANFPTTIQPADPSGSVTIYSELTDVRDPAEWVDMRLEVSSTTGGDTVVMEANSFLLAYAEACNESNEANVERIVSNLYFITMDPDHDHIYGRSGYDHDNFVIVPINGINSGFDWATSTGKSLYAWDGSTISMQ